MIETYSREIAVQEGVRKNAEINKGCIKRPVSRLIRGVLSREPSLNKTITPSAYMANFSKAFDYEKDNKRYNMYRMMRNTRKFKFSDLRELENFENVTFEVYVEKQHNNIYSLRNLEGALIDVVDVKFEKFVDIVGKALVINLDKKDGKCKINKIMRINNQKN